MTDMPKVQLPTYQMPWSEVCVHLRVADQWLQVDPLPNGMAQLYRDGQPISFPITWGEAGIRTAGCSTIDCHGHASSVIEHGPTGERAREVVCMDCAASYLLRPALGACLV